VGRGGRGRAEDVFHFVISIPMFSFAYLLNNQSEIAKERTLLNERLLEVVQFLVLPAKCLHRDLEERFAEPASLKRQREEVEVESEPVQDEGPCTTCPVCTRDIEHLCPPVLQEGLVDVLLRDAFHRGPVGAMAVVDAVYRARVEVWGAGHGKTVGPEHAHTLVLQLIAAHLLCCTPLYTERGVRGKGGEGCKGSVLLMWAEARKVNPGEVVRMAFRIQGRWRQIKTQ